ncbi:hypothetical protein [Oryzomonas rubra]|uniref:Uncharacterized protein n=1 Tax=Oryzomonas rubra TaxID=2509454 RepID=A0A5A9X8E8_9BACT|nr:hypothetical protein [Oryzomonas rubra]KAA0888748.1 hypothetical protein ET418_15320 [Oryzomonas rubra]
MTPKPWKNARMWRQEGYKTLFKNGAVLLLPPGGDFVYRRAIDSGAWMDIPDLSRWERVPVADLPHDVRLQVAMSLMNCYCDRGIGLCDFCAGVRSHA